LISDFRFQNGKLAVTFRCAAAEELKKRGEDEDDKLAAQLHMEF
jgi:hypothetical protein